MKCRVSLWLLLLAAPTFARAADERAPVGRPLSAQERTAATPDRRSFDALRMGDADSITLDGRLDEPIWEHAVPATDFIQQDPDNGAPATERTEVRAVFDRDRLVLGVTCYDSNPAGVMANTIQRDEPFNSGDRFMWSIDTFLDGRSGYFFEINPAGAMGDGLIAAGGGVNKQWDGIWNLRVRRSEIGWVAEIELPFRTFNFDPAGMTWGINFQRTVRRKDEESLWSGWARNQTVRRMATAGVLSGLTEKAQGHGLDVKPYVVGAASATPRTGDRELRGTGDLGLDVFYNLTPGLRANLTINTDFAQTEVDQRLVNLTRFPLFFPEKRDFFLEGANFLDFGRETDNAIIPFFSRRIGLTDSGQPQSIDVGLKLTGQAGRQDIGVLHVRTGDEGGTPAEDFTVMRVKRRVLRQSYVGALYTRRSGAISVDQHTAGVDAMVSTSNFAGTSQNMEVSGFLLWNRDVLGVGGNHAYSLRLSYPNDVWDAGVAYREIQEGFQPAIGFVPRTGFRQYNPRVEFGPRPRNPAWLRRISWEANVNLQTDMDNRFVSTLTTLKVLGLENHSLDTFTVTVLPEYERLESPFRLNSRLTLPTGREYDFTRYNARLNTTSRRVVQLTLEGETGGFYSGNRDKIAASLSVRPRLGVLVSADGEWNTIDLPEGRFSTRVYRGTARTQFNPWISLVNTVQYDSVSAALGWQGRLRWILRPGNDFYFVYTHNWHDDPVGFSTLDRRAATKFSYTHRF